MRTRCKIMPRGRKGKKVKGKKSTESVIYEFVCRNPGMCTYKISKKLKMTGGNVRSTLTRLEKKKLIFFKWDRDNPRNKKLSFPVKCWDLLPKKIRNMTTER